MNKISRWSLIFILLTLGCQDDENVKFQGILLRDDTNQDLGTKGFRDLDDWGNDGTLSPKVLKLLKDKTPPMDLTGTDYSVIEISGAYPNPASEAVNVNFNLHVGPPLVRFVLVNESMKVLYSGSYVGTSSRHIFSLTDVNKFPNNSIVRMYYSFSKEGDENFYVGHGDIWICRDSSCSD